jgi:hypothetical protein
MAEGTTQDFLQLNQIKDGVVILKNKGLRKVLMVSSLNFALKSPEEQESILYQFQNFLNSLDFSCQIIIQSRRLNITGYLDKLSEIRSEEKNELLKMQIEEYKNFISELIGEGNVMQKNFYVVVPFAPIEAGRSKGFQLTEDVFQRAKAQLIQRTEFVVLGLKKCGIQAASLDNAELAELFWALHHTKEAEGGYYPDLPPELIQ